MILIIGGAIAIQEGAIPRKYLSFTALTAKQETVTVTTLMQQKERYDQKAVTVAGTIFNYQEKISRKGNSYTTFVLIERPYMVTVHYQGHLGLSSQLKVQVEGIFLKVKQVGADTFYDEIEANYVKRIM